MVPYEGFTSPAQYALENERVFMDQSGAIWAVAGRF